VKFGVFFAAVNPYATPEVIAAVGRACEERSVDSIWVPEHVVLFDEYEHKYPYAADGTFPALPNSGMLEPFSTLSYLAAHTSTVRLATGICLLPQRNPVYTAKEVANVDYLSGGRFDFGIGVGWCAEEFEAVNVPFETRGRRTDEYIEVMKALWCDEQSEYHGELYDLPTCTMHPKPVQTPHPPLVSAARATPPCGGRRGSVRVGTRSTGCRRTCRRCCPSWTASSPRPAGHATTSWSRPARTSTASTPTWWSSSRRRASIR
jgi:probable F420-dependent oxidoreductase